jgi:hypothetical protein
MKIRVKLSHETRTIEHVQELSIVPDDGHEDSVLNVDNDIADDGGFVIVVTEEESP